MTFNYSKLATLKPKGQEEERPKDQKIEDQPEDRVVDSHQLATSGYPPVPDPEVAIHQVQEVDSHQKPIVASHRRGDRHSKNKVFVGIRLSRVIANQVKDFCAERDLQIQDFYELAASHYIEQVASHQPASQLATMVASQLAHDDLMIFKAHDDIIMLYRELTGRRWTATDDRAASRFNDTDRRLVELGMIHTYIQARGKRINSFAYFIPEIQTMIDVKFDRSNLDVYLKARRKLLAELMKKQGKEPINLNNQSEESK